MKETIKVEKISLSHRTIYTDIIINAPAQCVWEVMKDTKSYVDWAVFLIGIKGELKNKNKITAKFQLNPSKNKYNTIEHTIHVKEGKAFYWAEKGPLGIEDNHHFKIEAIDSETSRFIQSDEIKKGATFLLGGYLSAIYLKGYQNFNQALKRESEHRLTQKAVQ